MAEALVFFNAKVVHVFQSVSMSNDYIGPVRLSYKPYFFNQRTIFFSHNKSANNTFSHDFSTK
jgi:hypothetical protein